MVDFRITWTLRSENPVRKPCLPGLGISELVVIEMSIDF